MDVSSKDLADNKVFKIGSTLFADKYFNAATVTMEKSLAESIMPCDAVGITVTGFCRCDSLLTKLNSEVVDRGGEAVL